MQTVAAQLLSAQEVADLLTARLPPRRNGAPVHRSTVYVWTEKGLAVGGQVLKLRCRYLPGGRGYEPSEVTRFLEEYDAAARRGPT